MSIEEPKRRGRQDGDGAERVEEDFAVLYRRYQPIVESAARELLVCDADAENVAHDVFLRLWKRGPDAWPKGSPEAFFRRAGRNGALTAHRRAKHELPSADDFLATLPSSNPTPEEELVRSELRHLTADAIQDLPPRCADVIRLVVERGFSSAEIANYLGIGVGAVEKQRARGRRLLERRLGRKFR